MIILVTTRVAPSIGMTIACGADVTTIKKRKEGIFSSRGRDKEGQWRWRREFGLSRCDRRESNPTKVCGPGENKLGELAGAELYGRGDQQVVCFCWVGSRRISGSLRGRILNPGPLLAAGHATSLFLSAFDLARFGLIETLACSLHGYIPIPEPFPSPTSQGGLMELQAWTTWSTARLVFFLGKNCDDKKEKPIVGSRGIELSNRKGLGCLTDGLWS